MKKERSARLKLPEMRIFRARKTPHLRQGTHWNATSPSCLQQHTNSIYLLELKISALYFTPRVLGFGRDPPRRQLRGERGYGHNAQNF
jgi:hypothetical protein